MPAVLTDLTHESIASAIEGNREAFWKDIASRMPNAVIHDEPDLMWYTLGFPGAETKVVRATLAPEGIGARVEEILTDLRHHSNVVWSVGHATSPTSLGDILTQHGMSYGWDAGAMGARLQCLDESQSAPIGLRIERVGDRKALRDWVHAFRMGYMDVPQEDADDPEDVERIATSGFGDHPSQYYAAFLDGQPVATSQLFIAAGVAGIWSVSSIPGQRGRGIGRAVTLAPLLVARDMGYEVAILTGSQSIYEQLGFTEYFRIVSYTF